MELAKELRALFTEHELPSRVRLGIANQRIVARTLELPVMPSAEALEAQVRSVAPDHIPMPIDEAVLDFHALGEVETAAGPRTRVVVVAVRRETVERLHAACDAAGLQVEGVDLAAFGMLRALPRPTGATLYVAVGGLVNVAVANESGCLFTRAAAGGLEAIASSLADRAGLTLEHAHQWLRHVGLLADLDDVEGETHVVEATREALEEGVRELADTVRNSLNFYRTQESAEPVERGIVTGPALAIPGFVEALSEQLKLPLEAAVVATDGRRPRRRSADRGRRPGHRRDRVRAEPSVCVPPGGPVVIAAVLGAVFGSFLNVVAYRLPRGESLSRPPLALPALRDADPAVRQRPGAVVAPPARPLPVVPGTDLAALSARRGGHRRCCARSWSSPRERTPTRCSGSRSCCCWSRSP